MFSMASFEEISVLFLEHLGRPLQRNVSLRSYSSFKIGGDADFFVEAFSLEELKSAIGLARQHALPYYVIGGGYNLLFDDAGFRGLIIKNGTRGSNLSREDEIEVLGGTPLSELVQFALERSLEGFEFLAGIPGTLGGAVYGNAGAFGQTIGGLVQHVSLLDDKGEERGGGGEILEFGYRSSRLKKKHEILLKAVLKGKPGEKKKIKNKIAENLEARKTKHPPWGTACAGSYFKNPILPDGSKVAAGYLLEQLGAKELRFGDAAVFSGHANFIINLGRARSDDIRHLAQELKERATAKFGVELEEEVIYLPATSSMP
jgi:UDP-N-acetylmuramate dehydrogenase